MSKDQSSDSLSAQSGQAIRMADSHRVHIALNELCTALMELGLRAPAKDAPGYEGLPQNMRLLLSFIDSEARAVRESREAQRINQVGSARPAVSDTPGEAPYEAPRLGELLAAAAVPDVSDAAGFPDPAAGQAAWPARTSKKTPTASAPAPVVRAFKFENFGSVSNPQPQAPPAQAARDAVASSADTAISIAPPNRPKSEPAAQPVPPQQHPQPAQGPTASQKAPAAPPKPVPVPAPAPAPAPAPTEPMKKVIHLKNARVSDPYAGLIDMPGVKALKVVDDGGSGLHLDNSGRQLVGMFKIAGDFVIRLEGMVGERSCELFANIAAIPDPRSLWVSKDSDRKAPFWKPDEDSGRITGELLCVAASKRGRSHAKDGTFRDDDFSLWSGGPGGWHIAVVADGAGSAKFSRRGSQIAVSHVTRELPRLLDEHLMPNLDRLVAAHQGGAPGAQAQVKSALYSSMVTTAFNAAKAIAEEAHKIGEKTSALRTTLVITVVRQTTHGWFIAAFAIGDGGAAIFDRDAGTVIPLNLADGGEFAGQTRFLEVSEFQGGFEELSNRLYFAVRPSFTAVFAMTDGITDPKFPTDVAFANPQKWVSFWDEDLTPAVRFQRINADLERELLAWLDFWSPGNHDDRTLALMLAQDVVTPQDTGQQGGRA